MSSALATSSNTDSNKRAVDTLDAAAPAKQPKLALAGETVVIAGVLVWNEKEESTTWLTKKDFKDVVVAHGGKLGNSITSRTTLLVRGNVEKAGLAWSDFEKAIAEKQPKGRTLTVQTFAQFVNSREAVKLTARKKLSSARWEKVQTDWDKGLKEFVERPSAGYKQPFQRTERVLQAALMQQGRAYAAECE